MTDLKPQEQQAELFTEFNKPKTPERFPGVTKTHKPLLWSTTVEQLILMGIGLILLCCFIFFLGVMRGKSLSPQISGDPYRTQPTQALVPKPAMVVPAALPAAAPIVKPAPALSLPPKIAAVPQKSNPKKPYTIQLVTYKKQDLAQKEVASFRKAGYYSVVIPSGDYYLVCVGQYANIEEAKKDLRFFGSKYKDCFLRRR